MALKKKAQTQTENTPAQETVVEKEVATETVTANEKVVEKEVVVEKEAPAKTEVAVSVEKSVAVAKSSNEAGTIASYTKEAADAGFEGMEVGGFGSFPTIILGSDGKFECDDEDWGDDSFVGQLQNSRQLYLCKQAGVQDGPCAFTYDKVNLNSTVDDCNTVAELKQAWDEDGETMEIKEYLEVLIEIVEDGHEREGEFFIVKLPPSSTNPFRGQVFIAKKKHKIDFSDICVQFIVGKRKTSGTNKYYPWKFKVIKSEA